MRKYIEFSKKEEKKLLYTRTMTITADMVTLSKYKEEVRKPLFEMKCSIFCGEFEIVSIDVKNDVSVAMVKNILKQADTMFILEAFVLSHEDLVLTSRYDKTMYMIQHDIETALTGVTKQLNKVTKLEVAEC